MADDDTSIRHDPAARRYELTVGSETVGFVGYEQEGDALAITHTEVGDDHEGEGLGSTLVRGVLEQLREQGTQVLPYCPFVQAFLAKHPELQDVVPAAERGRFGLD